MGGLHGPGSGPRSHPPLTNTEAEKGGCWVESTPHAPAALRDGSETSHTAPIPRWREVCAREMQSGGQDFCVLSTLSPVSLFKEPAMPQARRRGKAYMTNCAAHATCLRRASSQPRHRSSSSGTHRPKHRASRRKSARRPPGAAGFSRRSLAACVCRPLKKTSTQPDKQTRMLKPESQPRLSQRQTRLRLPPAIAASVLSP